MNIVQGQYETSRRLEVLSGEDQQRRNVLDESQKGIVEHNNGQGAETNRRGFLGKIVAALGALFGLSVIYPIARYIYPPDKKVVEENADSAVVGKLAELAPNTAKNYKFNGKAVFVLNQGNETLAAMSAVCTHLGCNVAWKSDEKVVFCSCHGARYDLEGKKISGPQPADLQPYTAKVQDGNIVISKA
ncbi:MAG: ubiquinol-cytochrome c reductase iron-sulfur subunit [Rhizobacter sp.]|nr:ubiquinol-cytochrome c reductase iron-sulfur subunit [Chlorobiales bacterium]